MDKIGKYEIREPLGEGATSKVYLGYDGPVRVWINDKMIFEGPGTNPASEKLALYADLKRGANRLTIALDTNGGQAWGITGRVE